MKIRTPIFKSSKTGMPEDFDRPPFADKLRFPHDLTLLTPANISELHGKYTQLFVFANREATMRSVDLLRLYTEEARATTDFMRLNPAVNSQERWKRDAVIDTDTRIGLIRARISQAKQEQEIAKMFSVNYQAYIAALSRELSRRMQEQGVHRV